MRFIGNAILMALVLILTGLNGFTQPSGGPYGPIHKTYEIPANAKTVYYVAPDADATSSGTSIENPTTIETAIAKVVTDDAIILRGGTYRTGNLELNQGITIQPYKDEKPILKGTKVATEWQKLRTNLWITKWDDFFPSAPQSWWRNTREEMFTPLWKFNDDMVFVDGKFLDVAGWPGDVDENSYYIDYKNKLVYIGVDPEDKLVEITAFNVAIHRVITDANGKPSDKKGYTLNGINITQYAYRALEIDGLDPEGISPESAHGKDVIGATIENCEITYCSRVAGYFRGDNFVMRNCKISDTSTEGVYILSSNDVLLERNIFARNNIEQITGYYPSAVKIFNQCYRVTCNDNLVIDQPFSNGIWYDVGNIDGVFTNNWVQGVGLNDNSINSTTLWPAQNGFFFEISKNAICAGNVFVDCDHGVCALNSCNVEFYNNTFINSMATIARDQRSAQGDHFGWHPATGPDVTERNGFVFENNLMYSTVDYPRPLVLIHQPAKMCEIQTGSPLKSMNNNVYVKASTELNPAIIVWSPAEKENCQQVFNNLEDFTAAHTNFETQGAYLPDYSETIFKSVDLGNFELIPEFTAGKKETILPANISKIIGRSKKAGVGAYSLK